MLPDDCAAAFDAGSSSEHRIAILPACPLFVFGREYAGGAGIFAGIPGQRRNPAGVAPTADPRWSNAFQEIADGFVKSLSKIRHGQFRGTTRLFSFELSSRCRAC